MSPARAGSARRAKKAVPAKTTRATPAPTAAVIPAAADVDVAPSDEGIDAAPAQAASDAVQPAKAPPRKRSPRKAVNAGEADPSTPARPVPPGDAPTGGHAEPATSARKSRARKVTAPAASASQAIGDAAVGEPAVTPGPATTRSVAGQASPTTSEAVRGSASTPAADQPSVGTAPVDRSAGAPGPRRPDATISEPGRVPPGATAREEAATRTEAWAKLVADPGHAPELLALAAVQTIGPRARDWARRTRDAYPGATDAGLARLAIRQFARFGSLSSIFGAVAGSYTPVALLGAAALTHAELVLHLAAAYGLDPTDEERAIDLLVLTKVHPDRAAAEAAMDTARQPAYEEGGATGTGRRLGRMVAARTGVWAAVWFVNRFFPGTSLLAATLTNRAAVDSVANRANAYYSQESHALGRTV